MQTVFIVIFHSYLAVFVFTGVKKSATKSAKMAVVITRHMWLNISTLDQASFLWLVTIRTISQL